MTFRYCAATSDRARAAQAVNTISFDRGAPWGDNTDGVGLVRDLELNLGFALRGRRVLVMGAGGAAQGVVPALHARGLSRLVVANRTSDRARALASRFEETVGCGYAELAGMQFDLIVNATSAGLVGELPPLPALAVLLAPGALAYDMVYGRDTPFLALARSSGVRASDGAGMLVEQAAESFLLWRGVRPDTQAVLAALRRG